MVMSKSSRFGRHLAELISYIAVSLEPENIRWLACMAKLAAPPFQRCLVVEI